MKICEKCGHEIKENKITFKKTTNTHVDILLDGKVVGDIWSKLPSGTCSTNGDGTIQLCGFKEQPNVWSCSRFPKKLDLCVDFKDVEKSKK